MKANLSNMQIYCRDNLIWSPLCLGDVLTFRLRRLILSTLPMHTRCPAQSSDLQWLLLHPLGSGLQAPICGEAVSCCEMGLLHRWQQSQADSTLAEPQLPPFCTHNDLPLFTILARLLMKFGTPPRLNHRRLSSSAAAQGRKLQIFPLRPNESLGFLWKFLSVQNFVKGRWKPRKHTHKKKKKGSSQHGS